METNAVYVWRTMGMVPLNKPVNVVSLGFLAGVDNTSLPLKYDGKITTRLFGECKNMLDHIIEPDSVEDFEIYRYTHSDELKTFALPIVTIIEGNKRTKYRAPLIMHEEFLELFDGIGFYEVRKQMGVQKDDLVPFMMTFYKDKKADSKDPRVPVLRRLANAIRESGPLSIGRA